MKNIYAVIGKQDGSRIVWSKVAEHTSQLLDGDVVMFDDCLGQSVYAVKAATGQKDLRLHAIPSEYQEHVDIYLTDTGRV